MRELLKNKLHRNILAGATGIVILLTTLYVGVSYYQKEYTGLNKVLAVVGGEKIRQKDLNEKIFSINFGGTPENPLKVDSNEEKRLLESLIEGKIIALNARKIGVSISDQEKNTEIKRRGIAYDGFSNDEKRVTQKDVESTLLKTKMQQKILAYRTGSYTLYRFDKNLVNLSPEKKDQIDMSLVSKDKEYASALAKKHYQEIKDGKIGYEKAYEAVTKDGQIGTDTFLPTRVNIGGQFSKEEFLMEENFFDREAYQGFLEGIGAIRSTGVAEPFLLKIKNAEKNEFIEFAFLLPNIKELGEGSEPSWDNWLRQQKKELSVNSIFEEAKVVKALNDILNVNRANANHTLEGECIANTTTYIHRTRYKIQLLHETATGGVDHFTNVPVEFNNNGDTDAIRSCDGTRYNNLLKFSNPNHWGWADLNGQDTATGDQLAGYLSCNDANRLLIYLPDNADDYHAIGEADGGRWERYVDNDVTIHMHNPADTNDNGNGANPNTYFVSTGPSINYAVNGANRSFTQYYQADSGISSTDYSNGTTVYWKVLWKPNWRPKPHHSHLVGNGGTEYYGNGYAAGEEVNIPVVSDGKADVSFYAYSDDDNFENVQEKVRYAPEGTTSWTYVPSSGYNALHGSQSTAYVGVKDIAPGNYVWQVASKDARGAVSSGQTNGEWTGNWKFSVVNQRPQAFQVTTSATNDSNVKTWYGNGQTIPVRANGTANVTLYSRGVDPEGGTLCLGGQFRKIGDPWAAVPTCTSRVASTTNTSVGFPILTRDFAPGTYEWQASATDVNGAYSGMTGSWNFTVEDNLSLSVSVVGQGQIGQDPGTVVAKKDSFFASLWKKAEAAIVKINCDNTPGNTIGGSLPGAGDVCSSSGYHQGDTANLVPKAAFGWQFAGWTITGAQSTANYGTNGKTLTFGSQPINAVGTFTEITLSCVSLQAVPASTGVLPLTVTFTANTQNGSGDKTYRWDFDGDGTVDRTTINDNSEAYTYTTNGTPTARVQVTDSATPAQGSCSVTLPMTVNPWSTNQQREVAP